MEMFFSNLSQMNWNIESQTSSSRKSQRGSSLTELTLNVDVVVNFTRVIGGSLGSVIYYGILNHNDGGREVAVKYLIGDAEEMSKYIKRQTSRAKGMIPIYGITIFPSNGIGIVMAKAKINLRQWRRKYARFVLPEEIYQISEYIINCLVEIGRHGNLKEENILLLHDSPYLNKDDIKFSDRKGMRNDAVALGAVLYLLFVSHFNPENRVNNTNQTCPIQKDGMKSRFARSRQGSVNRDEIRLYDTEQSACSPYTPLKYGDIIGSITSGTNVVIPDYVPENVRGFIHYLWKGSIEDVQKKYGEIMKGVTHSFDSLSKTVMPLTGTVSYYNSKLLNKFVLPSNTPLCQMSPAGSKYAEINLQLAPKLLTTSVLEVLNGMVQTKDGTSGIIKTQHIKRLSVFQSQSAVIGLMKKAYTIAASYEQSPELFNANWKTDKCVPLRNDKKKSVTFKDTEMLLMDKIHALFFEYISRCGENTHLIKSANEEESNTNNVFLVPLIRGCKDYKTAIKIGSSESRDLALLDEGFIGAGVYYTHDVPYASKYSSNKAKNLTRVYLVEVAAIREVFPVINMAFRGQALMGNVEGHYTRVYKKSFGRISYFPLESYSNYVKVKEDWIRGTKVDPHSMFGTYSEIVLNGGGAMPLFVVELDNIFETSASSASPSSLFGDKGVLPTHKRDMKQPQNIEGQLSDPTSVLSPSKMSKRQQIEHLKLVAAKATQQDIINLTHLQPNKQFLRMLILDLSSPMCEERLFPASSDNTPNKTRNPINVMFIIEALRNRELQYLGSAALFLASRHSVFVGDVLCENGIDNKELCNVIALVVPQFSSTLSLHTNPALQTPMGYINNYDDDMDIGYEDEYINLKSGEEGVECGKETGKKDGGRMVNRKIETLKYLSQALSNILLCSALSRSPRGNTCPSKEAIGFFTRNNPYSLLDIVCSILDLNIPNEDVITSNCLKVVLGIVEALAGDHEELATLCDNHQDIIPTVVSTIINNVDSGDNIRGSRVPILLMALSILSNFSSSERVTNLICNKHFIVIPTIILLVTSPNSNLRLTSYRLIVNLTNSEQNVKLLSNYNGAHSYSLGLDLLTKTDGLLFKENKKDGVMYISDPQALRYTLMILYNLLLVDKRTIFTGESLESSPTASPSDSLSTLRSCRDHLKYFLTYAMGCCTPSTERAQDIIIVAMKVLIRTPVDARPDDIKLILEAVKITYGENKTIAGLLDLV